MQLKEKKKYIKELNVKGEKVLELVQEQLAGFQKLSDDLDHEIRKSDDLIKTLSEEDWDKKNQLLDLAVLELQIVPQQAMKIAEIRLDRFGLVQPQIRLLIDQVNIAKALAEQSSELKDILPYIGFAVGVADLLSTGGLFTGVGLAVSALGLIDSIKDKKREYDDLLKKSHRKISDDIARQLFSLAIAIYNDIEALLTSAVANLKKDKGSDLIGRIADTRHKWINEANLSVD